MASGFSGTQVVTEHDAVCAMYDYIALQLEGRFKLQFPVLSEMIDDFVKSVRNPEIRTRSEGDMKFALASTTTDIFGSLLICSLDGCPNDLSHEFRREFLDLVLSARRETAEWLKGEGIVPGQSVN